MSEKFRENEVDVIDVGCQRVRAWVASTHDKRAMRDQTEFLLDSVDRLLLMVRSQSTDLLAKQLEVEVSRRKQREEYDKEIMEEFLSRH